MATIYHHVRRAEAAQPSADPRHVARSVLDALSPAEIDEALLELLTVAVEHARRSRIRDHVERPSAVLRRAQGWTHPRYAPRNSAAHQQWLQTPEGQDHLRRINDEIAREQVWQERLASEGPAAVYAEYRQRVLTRFTEAVRAEITLELTQEVLDAPVHLYDGSSVPFGDLGIGEHMRRAERLAEHAHGVGETVVRHVEAARLLVESGAPSLRQLVDGQSGKAA